jgi:hypothetical protein
MSRKGVPTNKETKEKDKAAEKIVVEDDETEERQQQPSMLDIWNLMQETNNQNLSIKINLAQNIAAMRTEMVARMDYLESRSSSPPKQTDIELSRLAETQLNISGNSPLPYFSQNEQDRRKEQKKGRLHYGKHLTH